MSATYGLNVGWTNWLATRAYSNVWRLIPNTADRCITMTGADVDTLLRLGAKHRLGKLEFHHMLSTYAVTSSIFQMSMFRDQGKVENTPYHYAKILDEENIIEKHGVEPFGEGFEYEDTVWTVRLNGITGQKISLVLYVQVEGVQI